MKIRHLILATISFCVLFFIVKPVEVQADTYSVTVYTHQFSTDEDVQINGNTNIIIDSNITINTITLSSNSTDITVAITGDAAHTLECEQIGLSPGQGTQDNNVLIIESGNLKVKNRIEVSDIIINGGTIETESDNLNAILAFNNIVINGGIIEAHSKGLMTIHSYNSITINGGNVKATAESNVGIVGGNGITITGGIVEAAGGTGGIYADTGNITISGDNTIVKAKTTATNDYAIGARIGTVTIKSPLGVSNPVGGGVSADGKFIATKAGGTVCAKEVFIWKESPCSEPEQDYLNELRDKLNDAIELGGYQTVTWDKGTALHYDIMKTLEDNPKITLVFSYTYENVDFKVTLLGQNVKAYPDIWWYGPVYLYTYYGGREAVKNAAINSTGGTYKVVKGDTLTGIAIRLNTTVKNLVTLNNIQNPDKIKEGQVLTY